MNGSTDTEVPPGSRLFVVCGRSVEEEVLRAAFRPYGVVQHVRIIRDKGVAYVKFDKASSAALAMETLNGAVLNNGRGPKLKVLLAEAPTARGMPPQRLQPSDSVVASDPDNMPPRSRLFLVVPRTAEPQLIQEEANKFPDLEYVKTDLIASKGVAFFKFKKASSALASMEEVCSQGMLGPYKVKCMMAEPKTKRSREAATSALFLPQAKLAELYHGMPTMALDHASAYRLAASSAAMFGGFGFGDMRANGTLAAHQAAALSAAAAAAGADYSAALGSVQGLAGAGFGVSAAAAAAAAAGLHSVSSPLDPLGHQMSLSFASLSSGMNAASTPDGGVSSGGVGGAFHSSPSPGNNSSLGSGSSTLSAATFPLGYLGLSPAHTGTAAAPGAGAGSVPQLSKQRLFVVVHKSVSEDVLARLFRSYPGMEYCDLKKDKATGRSKGYCYVNYSTPAAAAQAIADLNGAEFPPHSGFRIKVMAAEIMTGHGGGSGALRANGAAAARPPRAESMAGAAGLVGGSGPVSMVVHSASSGSAAPSPSPAHTPIGSRSGVSGLSELGSVQEGLSGMTLGGGGSADTSGASVDMTGGAVSLTASPMPTSVARELMFTVT